MSVICVREISQPKLTKPNREGGRHSQAGREVPYMSRTLVAGFGHILFDD